LAKFAENLIVNEFITADPRREEFHSRYGFYPPFLLVLSPTMRCNLNCFGCYPGQYDRGEELDSKLIHRRPHSANYYRPCMIIDHPHILREVVIESGAHPTHPGAETIINEYAEDLDRYAQAYGKMADVLWKEQAVG
jgi:hypothetical protein